MHEVTRRDIEPTRRSEYVVPPETEREDGGEAGENRVIIYVLMFRGCKLLTESCLFTGFACIQLGIIVNCNARAYVRTLML